MSVLFTIETFEVGDGTVLRYALMQAENPTTEHHPIVFVPGLGGSVKFAKTFLETLVPQMGPAFSLDPRGFGINDHLAPQPNPADYLSDLHHFIQHLQNTGQIMPANPPLVFGISLGAVYVAMYTSMQKHPFKGAVLIAPAFLPHPELFTWQYKLKNYANFFLKGFRALTVLPYGIRQLTQNEERYDDPHFKEPLTLPSFYLLSVERLCKKAYARTARMMLPTAVIIPEKDTICDPHAMRLAYERIPHPKKAMLTYPNLYHDVVQEHQVDLKQLYADVEDWSSTLIPFKPDLTPQPLILDSKKMV
jgi:alpha-beta hydrolase superfamily lysophospholipase